MTDRSPAVEESRQWFMTQFASSRLEVYETRVPFELDYLEAIAICGAMTTIAGAVPGDGDELFFTDLASRLKVAMASALGVQYPDGPESVRRD